MLNQMAFIYLILIQRKTMTFLLWETFERYGSIGWNQLGAFPSPTARCFAVEWSTVLEIFAAAPVFPFITFHSNLVRIQGKGSKNN